MKTFCSSCGYKMEYIGKKPNFCSSCGQSLNSMTPTPTIEAQEEASLEEEEASEGYVPKIDSLDVEIDRSTTSQQGISLSSLANERPLSSGGHSDEFKPDNPKKLSKKQRQEEFQREAGTLRKSN